MSEPAANPGSDADIRYGMDRALTLAETGLDSAFPLPGRTAERYGERSGIYLSFYEYPSSGRDGTFTSKHYVMVVQRGAKLAVRSVPASASQLAMDLSVNGRILTGTWAEQTQADERKREAEDRQPSRQRSIPSVWAATWQSAKASTSSPSTAPQKSPDRWPCVSRVAVSRSM
jgi:hypothetical protein